MLSNAIHSSANVLCQLIEEECAHAIKPYKDALDALRSEVDRLANENTAIARSAESSEKDLAALKGILAEAGLGIGSAPSGLHALVQCCVDRNARLGDAHGRYTNVSAERDHLKRIVALRDATIESEAGHWSVERAKLKAGLKEARAKAAALATALAELRDEKRAMNVRLSAAQSDARDWEARYHALATEFDSLRDVKASLMEQTDAAKTELDREDKARALGENDVLAAELKELRRKYIEQAAVLEPAAQQDGGLVGEHAAAAAPVRAARHSMKSPTLLSTSPGFGSADLVRTGSFLTAPPPVPGILHFQMLPSPLPRNDGDALLRWCVRALTSRNITQTPSAVTSCFRAHKGHPACARRTHHARDLCQHLALKKMLWRGLAPYDKSYTPTSDFHCLDLRTMEWKNISRNFMFLFGGYDPRSKSVTADLIAINLDSLLWCYVDVESTWAVSDRPLPSALPPLGYSIRAIPINEGAEILLTRGYVEHSEPFSLSPDTIILFNTENHNFTTASKTMGNFPSGIRWHLLGSIVAAGPSPENHPPSVVLVAWVPHTFAKDVLVPEIWQETFLNHDLHSFIVVGNRMLLLGSEEGHDSQDEAHVKLPEWDFAIEVSSKYLVDQ
ncbi:hypothetical protein B0H14DRAFT_2567450 [Mycena olivaceomarginata]|nr:hypothetical protein B0H14DRAFT_2567450 [Mycena olivaceomarginata]